MRGARGNPDGLLCLREDGTLVEQAFDTKRLQLSGESRFVAKGLTAHRGGTRLINAAAAPGTIIYGTEGTDQFQLTWITRERNRAESVGETGRYTGLRISPDGRHVAVLQDNAVWQMDLARGVLSKMADGDFGPVWSAEGNRIVYTVGAPPNLSIRDVQAMTPARRLFPSEQSQLPTDWSSDGRWLLFTATSNNPNSRTRSDLWTLAMGSDEGASAFTTTPSRETNGQFSPDGKWIAYTADESGRDEIVVQSFSHSARKWQVSSKRGNYVRWRKDGKELLYLTPDNKLMAVAVQSSGKELEFGTPRALFDLPNHLRLTGYVYDVSPDGQRFLVLTPVGSDIPTLSVITNWSLR